MTTIFEDLKQSGVVIWVRKVRLEKKLSKNSETHGNKRKICKEGQVYMTTIFEDLKQGGVVIWVRKVRKVRLKNKLFGVESKFNVRVWVNHFFLPSITYFTFPKATIYQAISTPPHLLIFDVADQRNTSLAAPGALAHRLQRRTACNT